MGYQKLEVIPHHLQSISRYTVINPKNYYSIFLTHVLKIEKNQTKFMPNLGAILHQRRVLHRIFSYFTASNSTGVVIIINKLLLR